MYAILVSQSDSLMVVLAKEYDALERMSQSDKKVY